MMTKKERAAVDAMAAELAKLQAYLVEMDAPDKDVPVPSGWSEMAHGWLVNASAVDGLGGIRAAAPRATPTLHLEWHVGDRKVSRHGTVTAALLAKPAGGVLMFMSRGVLMAWSERGRQ